LTADTNSLDPGKALPDDCLSESLISIGHLVHNLECIRRAVGKQARIMGIVKADAYGHGAVKIAAALESSGLRDFGVANIHEAIELKNSGALRPDSRILAFSSPLLSHIEGYLRHGIDMTVCDADTAHAAQQIASAHNRPIRVQVKVDTGMGRLGVSTDDAMELFGIIDRSSHLELAGIYTHFAQAHEPAGFTDLQLERFRRLVSEYEHLSSRTVCKHAANSGAILCKPDSRFDMVRPGILLYGYPPEAGLQNSIPVKPVMQFQSRVIFVKTVPAGTSVSYNRTWSAPGPRRIATISAGYADGYHRILSNRSSIVINGKAYPQVGTVTMDQMMVDLGTDHTVRVGDKAVLFGWEGLSAADLAETAGSISYELLCSVSRRVRRVFL
jgi:alanine racemase